MTEDFLWWRDGIIYQIYPRSFMDTNHDGVGDLEGIRQKLDYLKNLGIHAIWLSPIYPSPDADFGYDVADYRGIDPKYGDMENFERLLAEAHQRDIHVIMDLVLNHTSDQHIWFQESLKSKENPYRDWYIWKDPKPGGQVPNNWQSRFGGSGWSWHEPTQQYYFHMFAKEQPDLNWHNPEVRKAILEMVEYWLEKGVDGFRLDVFNAYFKSQKFENNPAKLGLAGFDRQQHIYDIDQPELKPFLAELRKLLNSYPERYAVGETFMATPEQAAAYSGPEGLHATFDFTFLENRYSPRGFTKAIQRWEQLNDDSWPNYVLNNHDVPRSATRYTRNEQDQRLEVLAGMLLTLRGTPFLYYGEEIGMRDIPIRSKKDVKDPVGRHYWPFYKGRDGCRSPMQWNSSKGGGFTAGDPWLPLHENKSFRNVQDQSSRSESLYHFYKNIIAVRNRTTALQKGLYLPITYDPRQILAFLRQYGDQTVLVAINFSRRPMGLVLSGNILRFNWQLLFSNRRDQIPKAENTKYILHPYEVLLLLSE